MNVGKKSCIAPAVAVGRGGGASVTGKGVGVSVVIMSVFSGVLTIMFVGIRVEEGAGWMTCGVDGSMEAVAHPDRKINATGRRIRLWLMGCWSDGRSA
jgi:hypothetical protein